MTMPNETEMSQIKTNYTNALKCPEPNHWTLWNSYTDLSENDSDGNDYETLDLHRSKFDKYVSLKFSYFFLIEYFSICENPTEIDVREVQSKDDWVFSDSVLVHQSNDKTCKPLNIGISKNG